MAARSGRGARAWRDGRRHSRARNVQMTRHLVVCEGTETEPRYFEGVKRALGSANGRKLSLLVKGSGMHTLGLLEYAEEFCRYSPDPFDHVWLVYDKDDFDAAEFDRVQSLCESRSGGSATFHALWSNPCFEIWLLLHMRYTTAPMNAAECQRALAKALDRELGVSYRKNLEGLFALLADRRAGAVRNAGALATHHDGLGNSRPSERNPGTRVGDIFDEIGPYLEEMGEEGRVR